MSGDLNRSAVDDQATWPWDGDLVGLENLVDPHWRSFPTPSRSVSISLGIVCLFLAILSYTGNATVIYIFSKVRRLRNPSGALIINLALSDLCMMLVLCPMFIASNIHGKWIFGDAGCRFYGFSGALFGTASIISMTGIAVDKYLSICKPRQPHRLANVDRSPRRRVIFIIAFVWMYSFGWAVIPLFRISNYVLEGFLTTCTFDYLDQSIESRAFIMAMCAGAFAVPLLLIAVTYSCILWKVHVHSRRMRTLPLTPEKRFSAQARRELRAAKATFTVVVCWAVAWTPYAVVSTMGVLGYGSLLTPLASMLPALFAKTAAVYNPLVYALRHKQYSSALKKEIVLLLRNPKTTTRQTSSEEPLARGSRGMAGGSRYS